jgi:hypothetical protein
MVAGQTHDVPLPHFPPIPVVRIAPRSLSGLCDEALEVLEARQMIILMFIGRDPAIEPQGSTFTRSVQ